MITFEEFTTEERIELAEKVAVATRRSVYDVLWSFYQVVVSTGGLQHPDQFKVPVEGATHG